MDVPTRHRVALLLCLPFAVLACGDDPKPGEEPPEEPTPRACVGEVESFVVGVAPIANPGGDVAAYEEEKPVEPLPCEVEAGLPDLAPSVRMRVSPILFVARDLEHSPDELRELGDRLVQSLERTQRWMGTKLDGRSINVDRAQIVYGDHPTGYYLCGASPSCEGGDLAPRVARDLLGKGHAVFSEDRQRMVLVLGAGNIGGVFRPSEDLEGEIATMAVVGEGFLHNTPEACWSTDPRAAACDSTMRGGDWRSGEIVARLLGAPAEVAQQFAAAASSDGDAAEPTIELSSFAAQSFLTAGELTGGAIEIAADDELISDIAIGEDSVFVVWNQATGRVPREDLPVPPGTTDDTWWYGVQHTRIMGRLVKLRTGDDASFDPDDQVLMPARTISDADPVISSEGVGWALRPDDDPAIAYDPGSDRFVVVWTQSRLVDDGAMSFLMGQIIDGETGDPVGPAQTLREDFGYTGRSDTLDLVRVGSRFVLTVGQGTNAINSRGTDLLAASIALNGDTLSVSGEPRVVAENAKWQRMASDGERALVTWTAMPVRVNEIFGLFLDENLASLPAGDAPLEVNVDSGWQGLSHPTFNPDRGEWLVSFWENGGDRLSNWDALLTRLDDAARPIDTRLIASGPRQYQYDPSIAYVSATQESVMIYGDDAGPNDDGSDPGTTFFDGITKISGQILDANGVPQGEPLAIHHTYSAFSSTEVVAHETLPIAVGLRSGTDGVFMDIFQLADVGCAPPPIDPDISLVVHDSATLDAEDFGLRRTLQAILDTSGQSGATTPEDLLADLLESFDVASHSQPISTLGMPVDLRPGEAALDPATLLDSPASGMVPVALFNRFDAMPADGAHCGEHRIVYAKSGGSGRFFLIFEAILPNPTPADGVEGCRPVADFWVSLSDPSAFATPAERARALADFYYQGLPGFDPVVTHANYGMPLGQIRGNLFINFQKWQLREWRTALDASDAPRIVVDTVKQNPLAQFYDGTFDPSTSPEFAGVTDPALFAQERTLFQSDFVDTQLGLLMRPELVGENGNAFDIVNGFGSAFDAGHDEFQSDAQGSADNPTFLADSGFTGEITTAIGSNDLTAPEVLNRAGAMSCGGCHQFSNGATIGRDSAGLAVRWPSSAGFVHVTESGNLSSALRDFFVPFRSQVLSRFMCAEAPGAVRTASIDEPRDIQSLPDDPEEREEAIERARADEASQPGAFTPIRRTH